MDTRILSNQNIQVRIAAASGVTWAAPTLAQITALTNVSEAVNWDGFDFNLEASDQADDRTLTDAAGAQSRSFDQFGGPISFVLPLQTDTTSIYRITRDLVKTRNTELAIAVRVGVPVGTAPAAGQEWNVYRVRTDAKSEGRNDVSRFYSINFVPYDNVLVRYVLPSASPATVVLTPSTAITDAAVGDFGYVTASYESRNITVGGTWASSDSTIVEVTQHGIWHALATGGPVNITCSYPGGTISTAKAITVV